MYLILQTRHNKNYFISFFQVRKNQNEDSKPVTQEDIEL